jgi:hypothetical protein
VCGELSKLLKLYMAMPLDRQDNDRELDGDEFWRETPSIAARRKSSRATEPHAGVKLRANVGKARRDIVLAEAKYQNEK